MSHYFYDDAFDFVSSDGNFGYYIEKGNGRTTWNEPEEYIIEVHYIGDAITTVNVDVTNIDHTGTLEDLFYVEKGFIGLNQAETADGHRFGEDGKLNYIKNDVLDSTLTDYIVQNGTSTSDTYWSATQGGLDPIYGLIEVKIPNDGPTEANGYRNHDYLFLEAGLYFDVILQDPSLVASFQDLIDDQIDLSSFVSEIDSATASFNSDIKISPNATNDVTPPLFVSDVPHMIHFDNIDYYGYDNFSAPVDSLKLNTGMQMDRLSETTLIGEFRIDENAEDPWSFDAEIEVYLNNNTRVYTDPVFVSDGATERQTDNVYNTQDIIEAGATNTLNPASFYATIRVLDEFYNIVDYQLQELSLNTDTGYYQPTHGSMPIQLTSDSAIDYDNFFDPADAISTFEHDVPLFSDLNDQFVNDTGGDINVSNIKTTISKDANNIVSISETVPIFNTLAPNSTVTVTSPIDYALTSVPIGTYIIQQEPNTNADRLLLQEIEDTDSDGYYTISNIITLASDSTSFVSQINDSTITVGSPAQLYYDSFGIYWNTVTLNGASLYYDDSNTIPDGDYLVTINAPDDVTLTLIDVDTDFDGISELDETSVYQLFVNQGEGWDEVSYMASYINEETQTDVVTSNSVLGVNYETSENVNFLIDELDSTWNSVSLSGNDYDTEDGRTLSAGHYKVSFDRTTNTISLEATTFIDPEFEIDDTVQPYVLTSASSVDFVTDVNEGTLSSIQQSDYKQYFYDLINNDPVDKDEVIEFGSGYAAIQGGTAYDPDPSVNFDNSGINFINTELVTGVTSIDAGPGLDIIAGGVGGLDVDGGDGLDMYLTTPATINVTTDQNHNVTAEDGVIIDLNSGFVSYIYAGTQDKVEGIEYFMGTLGDDQLIGSALYSVNNGFIDASHQNYLQIFNPTKGKDEIFGADTIYDLSGNEIDVLTALDYDGLQGGQGVIFILDGSDAAISAAEGEGKISYQDISAFAGQYWDATSWNGEGWLPSNEDIVDEDGNFSTVSKYEVDKQGATLILDSFGDTDLAFNIDHYVGSSEADIFFGSTGDDSFDASNGTGNYMSGGDGLDTLIVTDQNQLEPDENNNPQDAEEDLNLDEITIDRLESFNYSNHQDVDIDAGTGKFVSDSDNDEANETLYKIDFAEVNNLSEFFKENAASELYSVSSEYALFIRTSLDLSDSNNLPDSGFNFDNTNLKIDVSGRDISILDDLSGQLVLAEEEYIIEGYIVQGQDNAGDPYSTVIENVEQVSLLSSDIDYFGTGGTISGDQEDIYQLISGGQGDLGEMLYVTTGETLSTTTGVGSINYTAGSNFISGEIFYSGHHTDFDRNNGNPGQWANNVASAYLLNNQPTAKIWNSEISQFFVWYDEDTNDNFDGYEIAVKYQNGGINAWGIDNSQFDTFQNVIVDQSIADAIKLQFGDVAVELGEYRVLYEAAYTDIETLISSHADVTQWDFDFVPNSSRSTFYIQVGGNATGENGSSGIPDTQVTNVKVERVEIDGQFTWLVDPQAEILVNLPVLAGADENDNLMISGDAAETIEGNTGSDIMMGRGGSDNYKISEGDTLAQDGTKVTGSYGVAGDVINEIGGSSDDKSDSITLSSATSIDQLSFSRTQIANEYWGNTLQIDVDYNRDGNVDDTIYVFDQFNQNLASRQVEQLFLDDGWDTDEIWNLIVGEETAAGTRGQDILIAGYGTSTLRGGNGKDIMIGDDNGDATSFELGRKTGEWDQIADVIQNFGADDQIDLTHLGITAPAQLSTDGDKLIADIEGNSVTLVSVNFSDNTKTLDQLLTEEGAIIYAS